MNEYITKTEHRPWGSFTVLQDEPSFKVKRLNVFAGKRLSLQKHLKRSEIWTVVSGVGKFTIGNDVFVIDSASSDESKTTLFIPKNTVHRIEAITNLIVVETQQGEYFGEDDIVRYEDDFGRV